MWWGWNLLVVIVMVAFLAGAIYTLLTVYVCDNHTCKAFKNANNAENRNQALLNNIFVDGMWPLAFIGAFFGAFFSLWLTGSSMTMIKYIILFLVWFLVLYVTFQFVIHHYIKPIIEAVRLNKNYEESEGCKTLSQMFKESDTTKIESLIDISTIDSLTSANNNQQLNPELVQDFMSFDSSEMTSQLTMSKDSKSTEE